MHFAWFSFSLAPRRLRPSLTVTVCARARRRVFFPRKPACVTARQRRVVATGYFNYTLESGPGTLGGVAEK